MDKRKRIYTAAGITAAVLMVGVGLWLLLRPAGVYRAIPQSAIAVVETSSWLKVIDKLNTTYTGTEFKKTELAGKLISNLTLMGNMLAGNKQLTAALNKGNTLISVHLASADSFDLLFTSKFSGISNDELLSHLQSLKTVKHVHVRIFKDQQLMDVELRDGKRFTVSNFKGILSFSATTFLTEASVSALLTGESIAAESNFNKARRNVEKDGDLKVYLNYKKAAIILPVAMRGNAVLLMGDIQTFADWGAYSLTFGNQDIKLNGVSITNEAIETGEPQLQAMMDMIPDNAAVVNVSYVNAAGLRDDVSSASFKEWVGNTKAFVTIEPLQMEFEEQNMMLLEVKDAAKAEAQLRSLASQSGGSTVPVDTFMKDKIYYLKDGAVLNRVFEHSFTRFGEVWFTVRKNAVIFCNNMDMLMLALEKISSGETLSRKESGLKLSADDRQCLYINPQRSTALLSALLKDGSSTESFLKQFLTITATSTDKGKMITTTVNMVAGSSRVSKGLLWKTKLKAMCTYAPQVVHNSNTREKEIFVQDTATNIYLLSRSGQIIFSRKLDDVILGKVYQLDYYNNGELQYLFNSATRVYVVDRMGNDVGSYPLRLSSVATAGLTLVTDTLLATNKYFIPCVNGAIYGYEGNGVPLSGWSPKGGLGYIANPLTAFKLGRKDYVAAYTNTGTLHLYDVKGNKLWTTVLGDSTNIPVLVQGSSASFRFLQAAGTQLRVIASDGSISTTPLIDSAEYVAAVATNDSSYTYFFSNGNAIRSYNNHNEFQTSAALVGISITGMQQLLIGTKAYIAVTDNAGLIKLYNHTLTLEAEYNPPISTAYSFNDLFGRNEVIVISCGTAGNISCTRIK